MVSNLHPYSEESASLSLSIRTDSFIRNISYVGVRGLASGAIIINVTEDVLLGSMMEVLPSLCAFASDFDASFSKMLRSAEMII